MGKDLVRLCFENEGLHYSIFEAGSGSLRESGFIENVKEVEVSGTVIISRAGVDLGKTCFHAYVENPRIYRKGSLVVIRGEST